MCDVQRVRAQPRATSILKKGIPYPLFNTDSLSTYLGDSSAQSIVSVDTDAGY